LYSGEGSVKFYLKNKTFRGWKENTRKKCELVLCMWGKVKTSGKTRGRIEETKKKGSLKLV
jgi:hypothetical protein